MAVLVSGYDNKSILNKALYLPVTSFIQYLTPFNFYDFKGSLDYIPFLISTNYNFIWLILIGPVTIFSFGIYILSFNKLLKYNELLFYTFLLGITLYLIPAFIYGGALPRYALPAFPLIIPFISYITGQIISQIQLRKRFYHFLSFYYASSLIAVLSYIIFKIG